MKTVEQIKNSKAVQKHENKNWAFRPNKAALDGVYYFQNRLQPTLWKIVAFRDGGPLRGTSSVTYANTDIANPKTGKPLQLPRLSDFNHAADILSGKMVYAGTYLLKADNPTLNNR